jgi:hypothetical protein
MSIESYTQYNRILEGTPFNGKNMEFDWGELSGSVDPVWMPYSLMFDEFARELASVVNELSRYTHQLAAWRDLLAPLDDQKKFDAIVGFVKPVATVAINMPYVIRSRFIFATAHLSHQANRAKLGAAWNDEFPLDVDVHFDAADAHAKGWRRYKALKKRMEGIGAKGYQQATNDFRNAYNHRFSPRIEVGITQVVKRHVLPDGSVSYGIGGVDPLKLSSIVTLLEAQCQFCYQTFEAFKLLVREHEEAIKSY